MCVCVFRSLLEATLTLAVLSALFMSRRPGTSDAGEDGGNFLQRRLL